VQRELGLDEDVGGGALPGDLAAQRTAVDAVIVEEGRADPGLPVIPARVEEAQCVDAELGAVKAAPTGSSQPRLRASAAPASITAAKPTRGSIGCSWSTGSRRSNGVGVTSETSDMTG
jgi:hypothetical protein